jgi:chromosomal replication initiation ATPase DnaA
MFGSTCAGFRTHRHIRRIAQLYPFHVDQALRHLIEQAVVPVFAVPSAALWADTRGSPGDALARQVAMYLAHVACGLTFTEVGRLFARDRTTVAHACGLVEDRREEAAFDRALELLEGIMRELAGMPGLI